MVAGGRCLVVWTRHGGAACAQTRGMIRCARSESMEGRLVLQETCRECVRTPIERLVERGDPWHHVRLGCESCVRLRAVCGLRASSVLSHVRVSSLLRPI